MPDLFGIDIAQLIADEIGPGVVDATLIQVSEGSRTSSTSGRSLTETRIAGKGFVEDYMDSQIDGTVIKQGDRKVILIAKTFSGNPIPSSKDKITIEGSTYHIINIKRDPAAATYTVQVRS